MIKTKLAIFISRLFDPIIEAPLILWLAARLTVTNLSWQKIYLISLFFISLLPALCFLFFLKKKIITDWNVTKREERYGIFSFTFLSIVICLTTFYLLNEKVLLLFYLKLFLPIIIFFLITFFWKISGHMLVNTMFILLTYLYYNKSIILYLAIILLLLVGWSRINLKKHTLAQVVCGSLLALLVLIL